jgi:hypothetical protein
MNLKEALHTLAGEFAESILAALRGASLDELLSESGVSTVTAAPVRASRAEAAPVKRGRPAKAGGAKTGRLARRSLEQIQESAAAVAALLKSHKEGLRAEDIRKALELDRREVPRILQQGLADKLFRVLSGAKRSTTYAVGASKSAKTVKAKPRKAVKAKPARKAKPVKAKAHKVKAKPRASKKAAAKRAPRASKAVSKKTNHAVEAAPAPAAA